MPLTYFAHQVIVLPLKWARPKYFDGTALCIGSMAPDFAYAFVGTRLFFHSHTLGSLLTWTLPVTLLLTRLTRRYLAEPLGAQLPDPVGAEVRALSRSEHSWTVSMLSAWLGGFSHMFLDSFTHRHGWGYDHFEVLHYPVAPDWVLAEVLQYVGHTFGTLLGLWMFWRLCVTHRVSTWNGSASAPANPCVPWFWSAVAWGGALCLLTVSIGVAEGAQPPVAIIRASYVALALLCLIAFSVRRERQVAT